MTGIHSQMRGLIAAVALSALAGSAPSSALAQQTEYLALGDSVAFGSNPLRNSSNPDNFIGYPIPVALVLREKLTNPSCPGETSSHFILLRDDANFGCGPYRAHLPLHVQYISSQLEFADAFLQSHPDTSVVSIDIGSNACSRVGLGHAEGYDLALELDF